MCDTYLHVIEWISYQVFHKENKNIHSHIFSTLFKAVFMLAREAGGKTLVSIFISEFSSQSGKYSQCKHYTP